MIGWFNGGDVDLTWMIEYVVQTGRARIVSLQCLLTLTGLEATESGIDGCVFGIVAITLTLVSVASGLAVAISSFKSARFT